MELEILKKKLSTFKNQRGQIRGVNDDLLLEVLSAWEVWTGNSKGFYQGIGVSSTGMGSMIRKAKKLKREGGTGPFQEISIEGVTDVINPRPLVCDIEVQDKNRIIRFSKVDSLLEYLKKSA